MILLLEPQRPPGFVSGGYRYQTEIGRRLVAHGAGELRAIAPIALEAEIARAARTTIVVVDGLFVERRQQPLPAGITALLHQVPERMPWSDAPLPVLATSQPTADAVASAARGVVVVRPGLDDCFRPGPPLPVRERVRIVCTATVWPDKGQLLVAEAIATAARGGACELVLIGDHGIATEYVQRIRQACPPDTLHLRGLRSPSEVADDLHQADLFVSASRDESFGMAVAEAVACGVPVLAFDTGEIATMVQHERNGWLLPITVPDATFRQHVRELLASPSRLTAARAAAITPPLEPWDDVAMHFVAACRRLSAIRT